jgi:hypothetical protein
MDMMKLPVLIDENELRELRAENLRLRDCVAALETAGDKRVGRLSLLAPRHREPVAFVLTVPSSLDERDLTENLVARMGQYILLCTIESAVAMLNATPPPTRTTKIRDGVVVEDRAK